MTEQLTEKQKTWLRGLMFNDCWTLMSATELGDPEVSELQSRDLVTIRMTLDGRQWLILEAGREVVTEGASADR